MGTVQIRRVVTAVAADGSARIASDGQPPLTTVFKHTPGMVNAVLWSTEAADTLQSAATDATGDIDSVPGPGGTRFVIVRLPPAATFTSADFDPVAAQAEQMALNPGIAEAMEPDAPGKHTTRTIDYVVMLDGELWLELDNGEETALQAGDVVVQNATRHSWSARTDAPATFAVVLVGLPEG
jgi:hypothetical protein